MFYFYYIVHLRICHCFSPEDVVEIVDYILMGLFFVRLLIVGCSCYPLLDILPFHALCINRILGVGFIKFVFLHNCRNFFVRLIWSCLSVWLKEYCFTGLYFVVFHSIIFLIDFDIVFFYFYLLVFFCYFFFFLSPLLLLASLCLLFYCLLFRYEVVSIKIKIFFPPKPVIGFL